MVPKSAEHPLPHPPPTSRGILLLKLATALILGLASGRILHHLPLKPLFPTQRASSPLHPSAYSPAPLPSHCPPIEHIKQRPSAPASPRCATLHTISPTSVNATIALTFSPPPEHSRTLEIHVAAAGRLIGEPRAPQTFAVEGLASVSVQYAATGLLHGTDYVLVAVMLGGNAARRRIACRVPFGTLDAVPGGGGLLKNGGFEQRGDTPYIATSFHSLNGAGARGWTPFYNGGFRVACGVQKVVMTYPRSGRCCAQLGPGARVGDGGFNTDSGDGGAVQGFYGLHQAVAIPDGVASLRVSAWVFIEDGTPAAPKPNSESAKDSLAMVVGWQLDDRSIVDPIFVDLSTGDIFETGRWKKFHDRPLGAFYVDDVSVVPTGPDLAADSDLCFGHGDYPMPFSHKEKLAPRSLVRHLKAKVRPLAKQLTIAVPLTADRVLRLETLSRLYGGGPIAAAVLVRDEEEAEIFVHVWKLKPWLHQHVDVTLIYMSRARVESELIPINALRNVAVSLASTDYTIMLDVDMTPATETFACFRHPTGSLLQSLVPHDGGRIFTTPVFITDVHLSAPKTKNQLLNMLHHRAATSYCLNSQKAAKVEKWYTAHAPYETRFMTDYEPYGIASRAAHPAYDERFVGYGFNKISWAWGAEAAGVRFFVLSDNFVTHLNHVDNDWVAQISVPKYLRTWRRYLAFVAEAVAIHGKLLDPAFIPSQDPEDVPQTHEPD